MSNVKINESKHDESYDFDFKDHRVELYSPTELPLASHFLWNKNTLLQINCRGYAVAQFMQPEPAKYAHGPNIEAKTFIQPEHNYYAHHPGRFFYIKDEDTGEIFSAPYEPVRKTLDEYCFSAGKSDVVWKIKCLGIEVQLSVNLADDDSVEMWQVSIINASKKERNISVYPYFTIGYMSWMNQSADFDSKLNAIVGHSITPYQKVDDYFTNQHLKDCTFLLAELSPTSWCANQALFEGEGGLHSPSDLISDTLSNSKAQYQTPVAVLHYRMTLAAKETFAVKFLFGPAKDKQEIQKYRDKYFTVGAFEEIRNRSEDYVKQANGQLEIKSPDVRFNEFVNHWLPRQLFYHGDVNRLTTDPQTRNYLQDAMGMCFIKPQVARQAICTALSQQSISGAMPDGVLLHPEAELKYINQIPHADHSVWLPILISVYLQETNDIELLREELGFADSGSIMSVKDHIDLAMQWLVQARDNRGLSFIEQGDWCDPMNMVGYKGQGVSAWLSMATSYALQLWEDCVAKFSESKSNFQDSTENFKNVALEINQAVNQHFWKDSWFARGINDSGRIFGINKDAEGSIYLNPQSWAILSGAANSQQIDSMLLAIKERLDTPFGTMMLAPSYTQMDEGIGRLTQKYPGVSENGSVYNHAAVFYIFSLYQIGKPKEAFEALQKMIPTVKDAKIRGQLPLFLPNYYRGAYHQLPESAGRSSHLFNTGTIAWFYRCIIECLCGTKGDETGLTIKPKLPNGWNSFSFKRRFRGALFNININTDRETLSQKTMLNGELIANHRIENIIEGSQYQIEIILPSCNVSSTL